MEGWMDVWMEDLETSDFHLFTVSSFPAENEKKISLNQSRNVLDKPMKNDYSDPPPNNEKKNESYEWNETDCGIVGINCSEKSDKMTGTFGTWMLDASRPDDGRSWLAEHFSGRVLLEAENTSMFEEPKYRRMDVGRFYQGCGHVVHHGSFYFHNGGKNLLVKLDLQTGGVKTLAIPHSRFHNLSYLFHNSKTYFKFAVDENGLWVIFASSTEDTTMVAKLDPESFTVDFLLNSAYPPAKAGNAFITCGVLYFTDARDRRVTYAFDLHTRTPLNASFDVRPSSGILAMLSYHPSRKLLYMWNNKALHTCRVQFKQTERK